MLDNNDLLLNNQSSIKLFQHNQVHIDTIEP